MSTVTLQVRAQRATVIARSVTQAQDQQLLAGQTERLADEMGTALARAVSAQTVLVEFGLTTGHRELKDARQVVADAVRAYLGDPTGAKLEKAAASASLLRSRADELEKAAAMAWQAYRSQNPPPSIDRAYLTQLVAAGFDVGTIDQRVEVGDTRLMVLKERPVPQPGDRETWARSVADLQEAAQSLTNLAPPEVRSFLSAAVSSGAGIEMVTPAVLRFLTERGLDRSFKVVRR
jgi:hypothetical protein